MSLFGANLKVQNGALVLSPSLILQSTWGTPSEGSRPRPPTCATASRRQLPTLPQRPRPSDRVTRLLKALKSNVLAFAHPTRQV